MTLFNFTIEGNLTGEPKLTVLQSGIPVCRFTLVRNPRRRNAEGKWEDGDGLFLNLTAWRGLAERAAELRKGDTVVVGLRDDFHVETYNGRAYLHATVDTLAVSLRFNPATSRRTPRAEAAAAHTVQTPDGEVFAASSSGEAWASTDLEVVS
ncbi:single-stranded DNA-binding protein [Cryptosporangium sp. NPDC048952]|uniref:single-stranded DNA-binding protein n=1 Tax=Cryptosporangium sp. NPDC048952 TaxID=3363961 RepID=UPI003711DE54